ncbi:protein Vago [Drosophila virilis]|uniref:Single domain-containing protein n=1 Tax=Drosophila virilis TaxID=7244 RepID=B4MAM1_DROVI|nr:uncharacterized protein LOC6634453 [Drosophila virilis]EDW66280.2 uncharacterized protein Dvir_GJ15634 [Drosophila virilis]
MDYSTARTCLLGFIFVICMGISRATPPFHSYLYNPQYCSDTLSGRQLYVGEVFTRSGQCVRVQCLGTLQLWEDSCKVPGALKGACNVLPPTEANEDYPRCCPMYECKTYESNAQGELEQTNTYDHTGNLRKSHVTELIVISKDRRPGAPDIPAAPARKYHV